MRYGVFTRLNIPNYMKPAIGGFMLGILALFIPEVLGTGYGWLQMAIHNQLPLLSMITITLAKIFATGFTISSGGSGGVFAPSIVIGGMLGGAFGEILSVIFPSIAIYPGAFVLVGMAAFFAGTAKVPIASMIMVSEMTGDYYLLVPLMLTCAISYILTGNKWTIYESQVLIRVDSPAHRGEFSIDILKQISVKEVMTRNVVTVSPATSIHQISKLVTSTGHLGYPVIRDGELVGMITYSDVLKVPLEKTSKVIVEEVMSKSLITTTPNESLDVALHKMTTYNIGRLPIVDPENPRKLIGIITKGGIIKGYELAKHEGVTERPVDILDTIKVEEVMRRDVVTVESDISVAKLADMMSKYLYQGYPVLEHGKLIGMITFDQLIKAFMQKKQKALIKDIVNEHLIVTYPDETVHQALDKMYKYNVGRLPVVERENPKKLIGIITKTDVIRAHEIERFAL